MAPPRRVRAGPFVLDGPTDSLSTADHFADRARMQDMEWRQRAGWSWRPSAPGPARAGVDLRHVAAALLVVALLAALLHAQGRDPICPCGYVKLWHGEVPSTEGSQHLFDWWTFSHVIHGFLFFAALRWAVPRLSTGWRLVAATVVEAGWEIVENSDWAIERYRTYTVSFDYNGDSILNAMSDVGAMWLGFALARVLPVWLSVLIVVAIEALPMIAIRDGLILNVLTMLFPLPGVVEWQSGT
jgi:hypothetical protein